MVVNADVDVPTGEQSVITGNIYTLHSDTFVFRVHQW